MKDDEKKNNYPSESDYDDYELGEEQEERDDVVPFDEGEEVVTYSGFAEESEESEEERTHSYGDFIIEEFSATTNVPRIAKITKLPTDFVTYAFAAIYFVVGVLCISITEKITEALPYIVGGMMVIIGFVRFIVALYRKEYRHVKTNHTATSLIVTALGIMIIIQHFLPDNETAITFISIVWGILGLFEGAHAFNHAFKRIANSERCIYYLIKGLIEIVVAFMLLYDPGNHDTHHFHIIVFGAQLIFDAITMIPRIKAVLATK